mmetsp:Transcript_21473/g.85414  ORF Transcript_21473/g.85414 Transcript_21473/m.85414 type:complete len:89 (-) Transcript_21473:29-295(-)
MGEPPQAGPPLVVLDGLVESTRAAVLARLRAIAHHLRCLRLAAGHTAHLADGAVMRMHFMLLRRTLGGLEEEEKEESTGDAPPRARRR